MWLLDDMIPPPSKQKVTEVHCLHSQLTLLKVREMRDR